jgi:hypothetical protein
MASPPFIRTSLRLSSVVLVFVSCCVDGAAEMLGAKDTLGGRLGALDCVGSGLMVGAIVGDIV